MARFENFYSGLVRWLKILLPLCALGILSSVVFFARENETAREITFLGRGSDDMVDERIAAPEYTSVTNDGSTLRLTADRVTPTSVSFDTVMAENLAGRIETPTGRVIQATAPSGRISTAGDLVELIGLVSVDTSDGFHMISQDLTARLDVTFAETGGAVRGDAPFGTLEAGRMRLGDPTTESELLVFNEGVKLIYLPKQ